MRAFIGLYCSPNIRTLTSTETLSRSGRKMSKESFEDIVRLYPHSAFNMNNFAAAACMAGDKATFQRLRLAIGKNIVVEAWPTNYSLDLCERSFAMQPPT